MPEDQRLAVTPSWATAMRARVPHFEETLEMKRMAVLGLLALASGSAQAEHSVPGWRAGAAATFGAFAGDDLSAEDRARLDAPAPAPTHAPGGGHE